MNTAQIELVQASFRAVEPNADTLADFFYSRLFALNPALREMFAHDAAEQKRKLLDMLTAIVGRLDQFDVVLASIQELGRRHADYGVQAGHYDEVESALMWALEVTLAESFTPAARKAWQAMYELVSRAMQDTAEAAGGNK